MTLFELAATLVLDTSDFEKKVNEAKESGEELGNTLGDKVTAKAVAMGNAIYNAAAKSASALLNLGKTAIEYAADVAAENAQFESAFGTMAAAAQQAMQDVSYDTGILDARLRSVGTKAFAQFKGSGVENPLVAMERYLRIAADAAAYYDITMEDADTRLRSFLRGNTEAGDAIGLYTSEMQRNTYALDRYGVKWQELTEAQRQMLMLDISEEIYRQAGAIGQAERESDSFANSVANLKESWRQTLAKLATPIVQAVIPALQKMTQWLEKDPELIEKIASVFGKLAEITIDALIAGFEWLAANGGEVLSKVEGIISAVNSLIGMSGSYNFDIKHTVTTVQQMTPAQTRTALGTALGALFGTSSSSTDEASGHATGLDYVPYNDYYARLHEGEAVLTKQEATDWRRGESGTATSSAELRDAIVSAVRDGMRGLAITMDGQSVGNVVTEQVSRNIATAAYAGRY